MEDSDTNEHHSPPSVVSIFAIIGLPIVLIVLNTLVGSGMLSSSTFMDNFGEWMQLIGHPFTALILANLAAWYFLGIKKGFSRAQLFDITTKSLAPAGVIILLTGAGGAFKQILTNTGAGAMLAGYFTEMGLGPIVFGFVVAALVRILQGSATVAMITAAGMTAPLIGAGFSPVQLALMVISIASGASIMSHVNDSGFWLVSKYLGLSETQTFRSWTVMTTILALTGFTVASLIYVMV